MKPLRIKIQDQANIKKVPAHVIEKDYALSYILAGIATLPELWQSTLGVLVQNLPECDNTLDETKELISKVL